MPSAAYTEIIKASRPKIYWPCDNSALPLKDRSGNGFDSDTTAGTGAIQFRLSGPMPGDYSVRLTDNIEIQRATTPSTVVDNLTLEAWIKNEIVGDATIVSNGTTGSVGYGIWFTGGTVAEFAVGVNNGSSTGPNIKIPQHLGGNWHHVVICRKSTLWGMWVNGVRYRFPAGDNRTPTTPSGPFLIGYNPGSSNRIASYAHIALYERPLPDNEIIQHWLAAQPKRQV